MPQIAPPLFDNAIAQKDDLRPTAYWQKKISELFDFVTAKWQKYVPEIAIGGTPAGDVILYGAQFKTRGDEAFISAGAQLTMTAGFNEFTMSLPVSVPILPSIQIVTTLAGYIIEGGERYAALVYFGNDGLVHIGRYDKSTLLAGVFGFAVNGSYRIG